MEWKTIYELEGITGRDEIKGLTCQEGAFNQAHRRLCNNGGLGNVDILKMVASRAVVNMDIPGNKHVLSWSRFNHAPPYRASSGRAATRSETHDGGDKKQLDRSRAYTQMSYVGV